MAASKRALQNPKFSSVSFIFKECVKEDSQDIKANELNYWVEFYSHSSTEFNKKRNDHFANGANTGFLEECFIQTTT